MEVFITVDTETWPRTAGWLGSRLEDDMKRDVYGVTPHGDFGVPYQMDILDAHGLKAVFFLESLFACAVGVEPLRELVGTVQSRGHEVQLHIHTEWLDWIPHPILPGRSGQNMKDFTEDEQSHLVATAAENLRAAGARDVCAFRAGNYGADFATLRALARNGIRFDTSHNACYLNAECGLRTDGPLHQPRPMEGVYEYPVSVFSDWPGHYRHAQVCACSSREMEAALLSAWRKKWSAFVIVSHGFEMLRRRKQAGVPALPDRTVIGRFERLCRFLEKHRDKFTTAGFSGLAPPGPASAEAPPSSSVINTAHRVAEQLVRRLRAPR